MHFPGMDSFSHDRTVFILTALVIIISIVLSLIKYAVAKLVDIKQRDSTDNSETISNEELLAFENTVAKSWTYSFVLIMLTLTLKAQKELPCVGPLCGLTDAEIDAYVSRPRQEPDSFYYYEPAKDTTTAFEELFASISVAGQEYHFSDEMVSWNHNYANPDPHHLKELIFEFKGGTCFKFLLDTRKLKPRTNLLASYYSPIIAHRDGLQLSHAPSFLKPYFILTDSSRSKVNKTKLYSGVFGGRMLYENFKKGDREKCPYLSGSFRGLAIDTLPTQPHVIDIPKAIKQLRAEDSMALMAAQKNALFPGPPIMQFKWRYD